MYQASSWKQPRQVVARLECSLQRIAGEISMRQEVDIRYVATSLAGSPHHLYENVYCQRGQMENLIKLHKAQLASDRMSCHSATANQVRLVLHTAAFWLMHGVRAAIPRTSPLAGCEFTTIRDRLIKIETRVIEYIARIRVQLPGGGVVPNRRARPHAVRPVELRGHVPQRAADRGRSTPDASNSEWPYTDPTRRPPTRREKTRRVAHDRG